LKVAIIGGGWAGLAAAIELANVGVKPTLFEAAKQLGGRARSVEVNGHRLDNGQHILVGAYRETLRLMQTIGVDTERLLKRLPLTLDFPGSRPRPFHLRLPRWPAPLHLAAGLLGACGATLAEKIAAARFIRFLQSIDYRLDADISVAELLDRHAQRGSLRRHLWEPLCLAALNTAPENASAQIFANTLRDSLGGQRADTDLLLPAADLDRLFPQPAADFVRARGGEIRLSTRIEKIDETPEGKLHIQDENFDRVILAVAPQHALGILAAHPHTASLANMLNAYTYEPIATVYIGYPPELCLPCPMLGLNGAMDGLGQWVFDRGALVGSAGVMAFVLSARGAWDERDNETLAATLHIELAAALQRELPPMQWHRVIRERRATFSCRPNLPRPSAQTARAGLWLAGDYVCADYPATLEGAVRSGIAVTRGILLKTVL
jgi:squalene-associated FAD-dependent desaturase